MASDIYNNLRKFLWHVSPVQVSESILLLDPPLIGTYFSCCWIHSKVSLPLQNPHRAFSSIHQSLDKFHFLSAVSGLVATLAYHIFSILYPPLKQIALLWPNFQTLDLLDAKLIRQLTCTSQPCVRTTSVWPRFC